MYNDYAEKYAFDPKVQQWMKKVNPWALQNIAETLLEAEQRQMWNADDETKEKLQELYLSVEGEIEEDDEEWKARSRKTTKSKSAAIGNC